MTNWLADQLIWPDDQAATGAGQPLRLRAQRCHDCGRSSFPATGSCTWCGGDGVDFALAERGTLVAATAVLHSTPDCELQTPYVVGLLRFPDAGLDVLGRVLDVEDSAPLEPGHRLEVVADAPFSDDRHHFAYRLAPTSS